MPVTSQRSSTEPSQRERILEAAVQLYLAHGTEDVSLRELTARAGVNLGAVNYHFGSKDALSEAVLLEVSGRVNGRRLENLRNLQERARAAGRTPTLAEIVELFIEPYVASGSNGDEGRLLAHFAFRHRIFPTATSRRIIRRNYDPMAKAFIEALAAAAPHIDAKEFFWRYFFMVSAVVITGSDRSSSGRMARLSEGAADATHGDELKQALMRFLLGGLNAPGP
jgi:AcrR family transcriptional regulator